MSFDLKLMNGDLSVGTNGDLAIVENTDKLIQDVLKILSTQLGANPFIPWYGCPITKSLIGQSYEDTFVTNIASGQLETSINMLQKLQKEQLRNNQLVSASEQIAAIQNIFVDRNPIDPRFYSVNVNILTKAFTSVPVDMEISY